MRRLLMLLALAAMLGACSRGDYLLGKSPKEAYGSVAAPAAAEAPAAPEPPGADEARKRVAGSPAGARYLAYAHAVRLDLEAARVVPLFEAVQAACRAQVAEQCVVLRASADTGRALSASLQLRASAAGIAKIMGMLNVPGAVIGRTMNAEDLTGPIEDGQRRRAMLEDYRTRLEGLRAQAARDIASLIKLQQELAQVQSQLEALAGEQAQMMQRVQTETLDIEFTSRERAALWAPVSLAFGNFGANLAEALAGAITFVAYALPFGGLLVILIWGVRRLWVRRRWPAKGQ